MRFLFLTQYFAPEIGAPQVRLASVVRELVRAGHEVEIVTGMPNYPVGRIASEYRGKFYVRESWEGVSLHRVWLYAAMGSGARRMLNYGSFAITSLFGLARAKKPDYLFVESPPLFLSVPAFLASRVWGRPYIFNVADIWPDAIQQFELMKSDVVLSAAEYLERWSYRRAEFVTTVTDVMAKTLLTEKNIPEEKLLFLPNGVDTELFRRTEPDERLIEELGVCGKKVFLYAGNHGYSHAMEVILKAAKLLETEDPAAVFVLVGDGSEKPRLVAMAKEMGLENVVFVDPVPPDEIARYYGIATAGLATLRRTYDTRLVKIFAAMACEKPVIHSGFGEGAEIVKRARAGIETPPEDSRALADAVMELGANPGVALEMGKNGRQYVLSHFSWSRFVEDWLQQLERAA